MEINGDIITLETVKKRCGDINYAIYPLLTSSIYLLTSETKSYSIKDTSRPISRFESLERPISSDQQMKLFVHQAHHQLRLKN